MTPQERAPELLKETFTCPHCGVYSSHEWEDFTEVLFSKCQIERCSGVTVWVDVSMVYPDRGLAPQPHADLPAGPRADYEEAASISGRSPRAAAGLLRLCIERLVNQLEPEDKDDLNGKIGNLVEKGLPVRVQQALDTVRCIGNNNLHPGQMDPHENPETVAQLFALVNIIVESMITQPKAIADLFDVKLTDGQKDQITRRDAESGSSAQGQP